ncbi:polycystic kidney disease protein 1-like [Homalodisca vitripennis]|nr:polycystic kidney disease protein 1-like [Homalodisca vitripennis]
MLYGLKLGPVQSKEWASTVLASTGGDTFISSPAKIIFFAIILTMAFQRMYDLNSHSVDYNEALRLHIPSDEEYLNDVITRRQLPMYAPLSDTIKKEILRKKQLKHDWWTLIDFGISALFIMVISTVISNIWCSYYYTNSKIKELITSSHHADLEDVDFFTIKSTTHLENYLEYTWMYAFYNTRWYNDFKIMEVENENDSIDPHMTYWAADYTNKLLGLPQVRQLRVKPKPCSNLVAENAKCIPAFNKEDEDTDVYGVGWTPASWAEVMKDSSAWKYFYRGSHLTLFRLYVCKDRICTNCVHCIKFGCDPPSDNNIRWWYHQFEDPGCLYKGKSTGRQTTDSEEC